LLDIAMRRWWARGLVAALVAAAVVYAWIWGFEYFGEELEMEFLAWPVGIGLAIGGYLLVGLVYRRFGPRAAPMHLSSGALAKKLDQRLKTLPTLTHTVHPLGSPWPKAVIGPTGVYVVEPVAVGQRHVGYLDGEILLDGRPADAELLGEVKRLTPMVEELLHERSGLEVPVQGVVAVDDGTIVPAPLQAGHIPLRLVPLAQFPGAVDFGEPLNRAIVDAAAAAIVRWRPATTRH
jgi:hypothetical protein